MLVLWGGAVKCDGYFNNDIYIVYRIHVIYVEKEASRMPFVNVIYRIIYMYINIKVEGLLGSIFEKV